MHLSPSHWLRLFSLLFFCFCCDLSFMRFPNRCVVTDTYEKWFGKTKTSTENFGDYARITKENFNTHEYLSWNNEFNLFFMTLNQIEVKKRKSCKSQNFDFTKVSRKQDSKVYHLSANCPFLYSFIPLTNSCFSASSFICPFVGSVRLLVLPSSLVDGNTTTRFL